MPSTIHIYGRHPVVEALKYRPDVIEEVFFASNFDNQSLRQRAEKQTSVHSFQPDAPPRTVSESDAHQGVVAKINTDTLTKNRKEFLNDCDNPPEMDIVILGELEDPQNVGAVIRSAAAFGFGAALIPQRRQTQITPAVVKVSAGAAFRLDIVSIGNVNSTIEQLKDTGFWVYGLTEEGEERLHTQTFAHDVGLVVGNEANGIRAKTREHCDKLVRIPAARDIPLNAASASSIGFYAVSVANK